MIRLLINYVVYPSIFFNREQVLILISFFLTWQLDAIQTKCGSNNYQNARYHLIGLGWAICLQEKALI